jgi:hypothetical protein
VYGYYTGTNDREPLTSYNRAPIRRHTLPINTEIPYANTAKSIATCEIGYASSIFGNQHLGIAVSWQNEIAVHTNSWKEGTGIYIFPDTGYELPLADIANAHCRKVVGNLGSMSNSSGIKFDPAGNIYVGSTIKAPDRITIPGFENDEFSMNLFSGSIIKYAASDTNKSVVWSNKTTGTAVGALKVYPQAYGTFTGGGTSTNCCFCNSPRFDLDPYGRLYIPNSSTGKITIADNEGNTILTFGEYGNVDCRGGLPGSIGEIYSAPSIPIAWPVSVAATEDYIYVGDYINARIVRVQKTYSVDNMPDFTNSTRASIHHNSINKISMNSNPNPFNPSSVIFVATNQPCNITLAVYNSKGERIRDLAQSRLGQGVHKFLWNGTDNTGTSVAAGLYIYQLKAGKKVLHSKTIFAK